MVWMLKTELSENADVITKYTIADSTAVAIETCARDSKKVWKKTGNANASFNIPCEDAVLFIRFRDAKKRGCSETY